MFALRLRRKCAIPLLLGCITPILLYLHYRSNAPLRYSSSAAYWAGEKSPFYYDTWGVDRYYYDTKPFFPPLDALMESRDEADPCINFPKHLLAKIQVVLKTGVAEEEKTRAHLETVTSCFDNLLVVSDLPGNINGREVIDILATLPHSYMVENPDFETYTAQQAARIAGEGVARSKEGWKLDRFKFLPMVELAYERNKEADWYVFIEADVYFFWDTLFRLLSQLNPSRPHYLGASVAGSYGRNFAYGGAGFVISQGLMKMLVGPGSGKRLSAEYEAWARDDCCGDAVLAYAIHHRTGVRLQGLYPIFAGEEIQEVKVDESNWCVPLLSLHRVSPKKMESLWEWERRRPYTEVRGNMIQPNNCRSLLLT
jgi:hypothetical protein